jgi:hypothetical protein
MPTKEEVIRSLVSHHFRVEAGLEQILVIPGEAAEPIKLLEVNANTFPSGTVDVFAFSPTQDVPFVTEIAEVTPEEFERLKRRDLSLPAGWTLVGATAVHRPAA